MDIVSALLFFWDNLAKIGAASAAIGVFLAYCTLRANHDWNRRKFVAKMLEDWNLRTGEHRRAIEKIMPGLIDVDKASGKIVELTRERAREIYRSQPGSEDWELRFHFIELLNYFEFIAAAYFNRVADPIMIEESFRKLFIMWNDLLVNFIKEFGEARGYAPSAKPWGPYHDLVELWKSRPPRRPRRFTDTLFGQIWPRRLTHQKGGN